MALDHVSTHDVETFIKLPFGPKTLTTDCALGMRYIRQLQRTLKQKYRNIG